MVLPEPRKPQRTREGGKEGGREERRGGIGEEGRMRLRRVVLPEPRKPKRTPEGGREGGRDG